MAGLADFGSSRHKKHLRQGLNPAVALNPFRAAKHVKKSFELLTTKEQPPAPPVVPLADEELIEENRRKSRSRRQRTGRSSTILSDGLG